MLLIATSLIAVMISNNRAEGAKVKHFQQEEEEEDVPDQDAQAAIAVNKV
jgi:hypothetical protein